jgi:hypothetical protein
MLATSELPRIGLQAVRQAIARSEIRLRHGALAAGLLASKLPATKLLARRLADWKRTRLSPDVDAVVLAWIGSHVPSQRPSALS